MSLDATQTQTQSEGLVATHENLVATRPRENLDDNIVAARRISSQTDNGDDNDDNGLEDEPQIVLIVATGRSASTTLQRIVNTIPNSNINGENCNAVACIVKAYLALKKAYHFSPGTEIDPAGPVDAEFPKRLYTADELNKMRWKPCWQNSFCMSDVKQHFRSLILNLLDPDGCHTPIGFKEIRWQKEDGGMHVLDAFRELFPNTKIVCHIKLNVQEQSRSCDWRGNPGAIEQLQKENTRLREYATTHNNCYLSTTQDLFDVAQVQAMFAFLGRDLDVEKYKWILANPFEKPTSR